MLKTKPVFNENIIERDDKMIHLKHADIDIDFILENCYAKLGDIVLVAGTLVEGIGNACSDIDVYVITDAYRSRRDINISKHHRVLSHDRSIVREHDDGDQKILLIHTALPGTAIKVDVEFKTFKEISELFQSINNIYEYAIRNLFLLTKRLTDREEVLVHRFYHCVPLLGEEKFHALRNELSKNEYIYIGYRWIASDYNIVLDLIGAWQAGEIDRAVEFARENVFIQTAAYLRLTGCTNFRRKWLLTYLSKHGDLNFLNDFSDIMYLIGVESAEDKCTFVYKCLDFVDHLFDKSRPLLSTLPGVPYGQMALDMLSKDRNSTPFMNQYETWEYEYRIKAYKQNTRPTRVLLGTYPST